MAKLFSVIEELISLIAKVFSLKPKLFAVMISGRNRENN